MLKISGKEVLLTGSVTLIRKQELELFPFEDDKNFRMKFDIQFLPEEDKDEKKRFIGSSNDDSHHGVIIKVRSPYRNGGSFSNSVPILFAGDDNWDYAANFSFRFFGGLENITSIINYTIYREEKG